MTRSAGKGARYESQAAHYLGKQGLVLLQQNFRCRFGEIDLIMQDQDCICFIEVKFRKSLGFDGAIAAIPPSKQRKIIHTARFFIARQPQLADSAFRFDAFLIQQQADGSKQIEWIKSAFEVED